MQTATRSLLLTDVVDSTRLSEELGDTRMAEVWAAHDAVARELLPVHRGLEIDKTDGFLMLFESADDAAAYALAYHAALAGLSAELGVALAARAGLHVGEVVLRRNPPDQVARGAKPLEVDGLAKPTAARVMSVAGAGQTLVTAEARAALGDGPRVVSHGHWRMKGIAEPRELFEVGGDDAPFRPPEDGGKVYRVVHQGDLWIPVSEVRHNLHAARDAFVGRQADLSELARLVTASRLVVVLGQGGTGKTRLTQRFAWQWLGDFPGGVWFCDLSDARTELDVLSAVGRALQVPLEGEDPVAQLGHAMAARGRALVLLDNFEQVAAHADATVGRWLDLVPEASFVVTSRVVLGLPGEQEFPLEPLPLDTDAIALFEARARARSPRFAVSDANRADVAAIVRKLDGLPLAIELAAARIAVLQPAALLARLEQRFKLLAGAKGTQRQATLRAAIDWSWDLLVPWERAALAQCSAFEGGFTLEAAEAVLDLSAFPDAPWGMDAVQQLVDKSLLRSLVGRHDLAEPWFGLYVSIHEYAAEKLRTPGAFEGSGPEGVSATWARHGAWYASMGEPSALAELAGAGAAARRAALTVELENLRVACVRAVDRGDGACAVPTCVAVWSVAAHLGPASLGSELAAAVLGIPGLDETQRLRVGHTLTHALWTQGRVEESAARGEALLAEASVPSRWRARLADTLAYGYVQRHQYDAFERLVAQAFEDLRLDPSPGTEAVLRGHRAHMRIQQGRLAEGDEEIERALACARAVGSVSAEGAALNIYGTRLVFADRVEQGIAHLERARELAVLQDDRRAAATAGSNLGIAYFRAGRSEDAIALYQEALAVHRDVGAREMIAVSLVNLSNQRLVTGDYDAARRDLDEALAIFASLGDVSSGLFGHLSRAILDAIQGRHEEARVAFERVLASFEQAGVVRMVGVCHGYLARTHNKLGHPELARPHIAKAQASSRSIDDHHGLARASAVLAVTEGLSGDRQAARAALEEAERHAAAVDTGAASEIGRFLLEAREALQA